MLVIDIYMRARKKEFVPLNKDVFPLALPIFM